MYRRVRAKTDGECSDNEIVKSIGESDSPARTFEVTVDAGCPHTGCLGGGFDGLHEVDH